MANTNKRLADLEKQILPDDKNTIRVFICYCGHKPGEPCTCPDRPELDPNAEIIGVGIDLEAI